MTSYPDLSRRVRVQGIVQASTYRHHYFTAPKRSFWRFWVAPSLLAICAAVLLGEVARYVEFVLR